MLPVSAGSSAIARAVWIELGVCSIAQPHSSVAGRVAANSRAPARIVSAFTQVIGAAHSGVKVRTCAASRSNP